MQKLIVYGVYNNRKQYDSADELKKAVKAAWVGLTKINSSINSL